MDRRTGNLDSAFWSKKRLSRLCTRCSPRFFIFFYFLFSIEFDRADDIIIGPDPVDPLPPLPPTRIKTESTLLSVRWWWWWWWRWLLFWPGQFVQLAAILFCFFFALNDVDDGKLSFDFTDPIQISPDVKTKKNEIDVSRRRSFHPIPSIPLFFYLKNSISMSRFHPVSNETWWNRRHDELIFTKLYWNWS